MAYQDPLKHPFSPSPLHPAMALLLIKLRSQDLVWIPPQAQERQAELGDLLAALLSNGLSLSLELGTELRQTALDRLQELGLGSLIGQEVRAKAPEQYHISMDLLRLLRSCAGYRQQFRDWNEGLLRAQWGGKPWAQWQAAVETSPLSLAAPAFEQPETLARAQADLAEFETLLQNLPSYRQHPLQALHQGLFRSYRLGELQVQLKERLTKVRVALEAAARDIFVCLFEYERFWEAYWIEQCDQISRGVDELLAWIGRQAERKGLFKRQHFPQQLAIQLDRTPPPAQWLSSETESEEERRMLGNRRWLQNWHQDHCLFHFDFMPGHDPRLDWHSLSEELKQFQHLLLNWFANRILHQAQALQQFSVHHQQQGLGYRAKAEALHQSLRQLEQNLLESGLFEQPWRFTALSFRQCERELEQWRAQVGALLNALPELPAFYSLKHLELQLLPLERQAVQACLQLGQTGWDKALEAWHKEQWLVEQEQKLGLDWQRYRQLLQAQQAEEEALHRALLAHTLRFWQGQKPLGLGLGGQVWIGDQAPPQNVAMPKIYLGQEPPTAAHWALMADWPEQPKNRQGFWLGMLEEAYLWDAKTL
jgi:hypothetical protein